MSRPSDPDTGPGTFVNAQERKSRTVFGSDTIHGQETEIVQVVSPALTPYTKAWVRRFLYLSFLNFLIAGVFALFMRTDQAGQSGSLGMFGTAGVFGQLLTAHGLGMFVGWQFPFTYGLCLYVFPKYMKRRLWNEKWLPRIFYTFFVGMYMVWIAVLFGFGPGWYFLMPLPILGGPGASAPWPLGAAFVFFLGMIIVNVSLVLFCIEIFGTAFSGKYNDDFNTAPGMNHSLTAKLAASMGFDAYMPGRVRNRLMCYPVATIGAMVATVDMFLSMIPFTVLLVDGASGSLELPTFINNLVAKNFLWLNYHPIVYLAFFPLVGIYYTLLPVFAKKSFADSRWVRYPWPLLLIPAVGVYSHHLFQDTAQPFGLQIMSSYMTMVIALGSGISVFTLMGLVWRSDFEWNLTGRWIMGAILGWIFGGVMGVELGNISENAISHNTYIVIAHFHFNALGGIILGAFGFLYWVLPEISNKQWYSKRLSELHFWGTMIGVFGMLFTFTAMGFLSVPRREFAVSIPVLPFTAMYDPYLVTAAVFAFVIAFSQIPFMYNIVATLSRPSVEAWDETPMPTPEMIGHEPGKHRLATSPSSSSMASDSNPEPDTYKTGRNRP
jgi:heme/copper-type cytochrome/quinol oxidase subunit 1